MSVRRHAAAFAAGAAGVAAFAPAGFFPLLPLSLAVLVHLWVGATPRQCLASGLAFGLGFFGAGVSWIFVSLSRFGGMPAPLAALATFLFCLLLAGFPAAAGWLQARFPAPERMRACLVIPAAWTLLEWLRGWFLTGFPWLSAGYAATGWPLQGYAPLGGAYLAGFLTVAAAGLLWVLAVRPGKLIAGAALAALLAAGQGLRAIEWTAPEGAPVGAALLQGNIPQDLKFEPGRYSRILETYARLAEESRARLIVLPETAIPRFLHGVSPDYLGRLERAALANQGDLMLGVPIRAGAAESYNSIVTLGSSPSQAYHKSHLVPFGEFIPSGFRWTLQLLSIPLSDFSPGPPQQRPLEIAGLRVAPNVCYEDAFGEAIARQAREAGVLVNASNVAWFGDSLAPAQHLQIAALRAVETGRMHLAATNTGITAAIDRDGRVLARLPQFEEGRLEVAVQGYTGRTPYMVWLDWPAIALCLAILAAVLRRARRSR